MVVSLCLCTITCHRMLEGIGETLPYKFLLDSIEHAFEHRRILPIPSLGIQLPFGQSYGAWDLRELNFDASRTLTC